MGKLICGKNSVRLAIKNKWPISKVYLSSKIDFKIPKNIQLEILEKKELLKISKINHQGIIAELKFFPYYSIETIFKDKADKVIILDHIYDPRNFGAIIRSANAFNIKHIVIPKKRAIGITNTVLKISSGGFVNIKIIKVSSLLKAVSTFKKNNYWIYGTTTTQNSKKLSDTNFAYPLVLILGNEEKGVSRTLLKECDEKIFISTYGDVQSLNVSVAAGIIFYHLNKNN